MLLIKVCICFTWRKYEGFNAQLKRRRRRKQDGCSNRQPSRQTEQPEVQMRFITPCMSMLKLRQIHRAGTVCGTNKEPTHSHTHTQNLVTQKFPQLHAHFPISFYSLTSRVTITWPTGVINISNMENYANTLPPLWGQAALLI